MKILITGGGGYVASRLQEYLSKSHDVIKVGRSDFDLTDFDETRLFFKDHYFDVIIHCAIDGGHRLIKDTITVLDNNLKMYYNLLDNRDHYKKFINIGSGAEDHLDDQPYGMSKKIIARSILEKENFYSLKLYALFDEQELDTRFIKANLLRYIKGEPMEVYQNKLMDFFYVEDFYKVIDYYISKNEYSKPLQFECSYNDPLPHSLLEVAKFINNLENKKVEIKLIDQIPGIDYIANSKTMIPIEFIGLKEGIRKVYNKLK